MSHTKAKSKILVTGGAGYIGSHTVVALEQACYQAIIADDFSNSDASVLQGISKITGREPICHHVDLKHKEALQSVFDEHKISAVIHFAASKAVGESVKNPLAYYENNLMSTLNLLSCMKENKVDYLIFSSSCTVYGQPEKLPVTEQTPIQAALSPYGNTKQVCEEIIADTIAASDHLKAISLRYFNPIGAHPSGHIGEKPQGIPNNLIPYLLKVVSGELSALSVFGQDYSTPDGTCIRDYIHVVDLALAHVKAVERLITAKNQAPYEIFNLGTGRGYSVLEVINTFERVTGQKVNYKVCERRAGDIEKIYADTHKANQDLGWQAKLNLEDMLSSAWRWESGTNTKNQSSH